MNTIPADQPMKYDKNTKPTTLKFTKYNKKI